MASRKIVKGDRVQVLQGKDRGTLGAIKQTMFGSVVRSLTDD